MNRKELYQQIDQVKWSQYEDAYGDADQVPIILKDLLSTQKEVYEEAEVAMYSHLCHQGSVYSATAAVVPILLQWLQEKEISIETRIFILHFLKDAGGLSYNQYEELNQEYPESDDLAVYQKCVEGFPVYMKVLEQGTSKEQILAVRMLGSLFSYRDEIVPRFIQLLDQSQDPIYWATTLFSISQLGGDIASTRLLQEISSLDPWHKICGALALCSCLAEKTPKQVIPVLVEGLHVSKEIEEDYEKIPWSDWPLPIEIAAALSTWGPEIGDQVIPPLLQKMKVLEPIDTIALGRYLLALSLGNGELPFASCWPDVLSAIADNESFWKDHINAYEVLDDWNLRPDEDLEPTEMDENWRQWLRDLVNRFRTDSNRDEHMKEWIHRQIEEDLE